MRILNTWLENDIVKKGSLLNAADWALTPCRKAFNGKNVELISNKDGTIQIKESFASSPGKFEKVLWIVVAVVTIPLAAIAAFFKLLTSPSVRALEMGNPHHLLNNMEEVVHRLKPLKEAGLGGCLNVYLALTPEQYPLADSEAGRSIIHNIERMKITGVRSVDVTRFNNQNEPGKIHRFAIVECRIALDKA